MTKGSCTHRGLLTTLQKHTQGDDDTFPYYKRVGVQECVQELVRIGTPSFILSYCCLSIYPAYLVFFQALDIITSIMKRSHRSVWVLLEPKAFLMKRRPCVSILREVCYSWIFVIISRDCCTPFACSCYSNWIELWKFISLLLLKFMVFYRSHQEECSPKCYDCQV